VQNLSPTPRVARPTAAITHRRLQTQGDVAHPSEIVEFTIRNSLPPVARWLGER
jgi:hypothetical protein